MKSILVLLRMCGLFAAVCSGVLCAQNTDSGGTPGTREDYTIDREEVFEFARKPQITRKGDRVTIAFETKGFCDATVAIEDMSGKILRHLASGVLGPNAPEPFQKNSNKQRIVWDGKNDQGRYVTETAADYTQVRVRVSLGLKARFERQFLWSPHRRISVQGGTHNTNEATPALCTQPEGVYVFDGHMYDHVRLFDHNGNYVRTVYPFPAAKLDRLNGMKKEKFPQSGRMLPVRRGTYETTFLTSGTNFGGGHGTGELHGVAATGMAVRRGRIALVCRRLNRLAADGSTGGFPLEGPSTQIQGRLPRSAAFSPDGKTLYVTGFSKGISFPSTQLDWIQGVARIDFAAGKKMEVFAGSLSPGAKHGGSKPGQFKTPSCVDCGPEGRVYVADHFNNRIQVFDPSGKHLRSISVDQPSEVCVNRKNGEIFVFSWYLDDRAFRKGRKPPKPLMTHFGPFDNPKVKAEYPLMPFPISKKHMAFKTYGTDWVQGRQFRAAVDSWTPGDSGPYIWMIPWVSGRGGSAAQGSPVILRMDRKKKKLVNVRNFAETARKHIPRLEWSGHGRDRIYVRPTTGKVYVLGDGFTNRPLVIDPETGETRIIRAPFAPDEIAFDISGHVYLRSHRQIVRYGISPSFKFREIPFDYGVESGGRISAIPIDTPNLHHEGGIWVAPKGTIVAAYIIGKTASGAKAWVYSDFAKRARAQAEAWKKWKPWTPFMFPGRGGINIVRVWDRHGKVVYGDAVRGVGYIDGIFLDRDGALYVTSAGARTGGFSKLTGTLVKFRPEKKILTTEAKIPLRDQRPKRKPDTTGGGIGPAWWEEAEWFYGGIGITGKDAGAMHACNCPNYRPAHDWFARTFVPETRHYTVGVLDSAGNVIMRIGQYGNVDDGVPFVSKRRVKGWKPKPLGGDEVGLFYPAYLGTDTDRRLYVTDQGNMRILSVKLGYHTDVHIPLKDS